MLAYLEDLARPQKTAPQDVTEAMPLVMGAMSLGTKVTTLVMCEALRQLRSPERTLRNLQAASDQMRTTAVSSELRKTRGQPSATLAVPRIIMRPSSGQSRPERYKAAIGAPPRMRKSNFVQQLSAAARFTALPEECAEYLVQSVTPQLAHNPEREEAMPSKHSQAPATAVEARASVTLSETAQNAANPASIIPPSACDIPAHIPKPASTTPSAILSVRTRPTLRQLAPVIQLALCPAFAQSRTASPIQPAYPPHSACDTSSIPASARDLHSVPSSIQFSIPECPQLAPQIPQTPTAIQSQLQWP